MSGIAHSVRKRLSIATTRTKTVEKNISAEYTSQKRSLLHSIETLENAVGMVKKKAHSEFADSYKKFTDLISLDTPVDTALYAKTREANEVANSIFNKAKIPLQKESSAARLIAHVEAYMAELKVVEKEFNIVEVGFVEVSRYEKKVGKLSEKVGKAADKTKGSDKVVDRTRRNLDKLESERTAFNSKLQSVVDMTKKCNAKYEKILDCIYTAFWLSENDFLTSTIKVSQSVRDACIASEDELVALDVSAM